MWSEITADELPKDTAPFVPFVHPSAFNMAWIIMITLGIGCMGYFFIYSASTPVKLRDIKMEVILGLLSSVCMGYGCLFLLLWAGVWV
mmetsp:Transcript_9612/g.15217  ORF Transcript_9612/g.15217 Transcript_9612/m.15217 type:complete len:88 (-) Transcript_9612:194-457(-)|eukprot:1031525-Amorphochlora_amoeboformis.AAC.1